ncbi:DUF2946 family protein [Uliginosibacterium sp. 31-16]|uniref:DUF2946 family protein n=1 Tax=Uliginosibacterium sp. 31-16 TaxID=3068315 RepID=UPI00273D2F83|nr:DUF2946 family protein [Uliginosibacterium sp. 31-16]MDP5241388.1 DUF2946 family protein [Uliginosibacterium sp. 31-16]
MNHFARLSVIRIALLAVLMHALMPLLMALPVQVGVSMQMCSTLGAKSVFVQFDTSGKGAPDKGLQARCPLCLAGTLFALMPPADARPALLSGLLHVQAPVPLAALARAAVWPRYHPRAPPVA